MRTTDFDYSLPPERIAQEPASPRDQSRLLVLSRATGQIEHRCFTHLAELMREGDVLIANDSKVFPARLRAFKPETAGEIELLLLRANARNDWWAMVRPGKRVRLGTSIQLRDRTGQTDQIKAVVLEKNEEGHCRLNFTGVPDITGELHRLGEPPLPPYIERASARSLAPDDECYQTIYAQQSGSIAAPTAGLHFTKSLLEKIRKRGVEIHHLTLHVGLGTFAPVKADEIERHAMHEERFTLSTSTAEAVQRAKSSGGRVFAVGTTTVRVLETVAERHDGRLVASDGSTRIFIYPPRRFQVVDALVTNFHLPCSTLLMLVSAFAAPGELGGRDIILRTYAEAIREHYRFFSYGDAMVIL